jgi:hypothetical protein
MGEPEPPPLEGELTVTPALPDELEVEVGGAGEPLLPTLKFTV